MSTSTSCLATELLGLLATTLCTFLLWESHETHPSMRKRKLQITVYSDNKEAIGKCNEEALDLNVTEHRQAEYDLEKLVWDIQKTVPIKFNHVWIKGHQNETKKGVPIYGLFPRDVHLNIEMDKLASKRANLGNFHTFWYVILLESACRTLFYFLHPSSIILKILIGNKIIKLPLNGALLFFAGLYKVCQFLQFGN